MKHGARLFACTLLATALAGCGGSEDAENEAKPRSMDGVLLAPECGGGYGLENSQVILRDEAEEIIGTAKTGANLVTGLSSPCAVEFSLDDVPKTGFYTIEIGTHSGPAWSLEELEDMDFDPVHNLDGAEIPTGTTGTDMCEAIGSLNNDLLDEAVIDTREPWTAALAASSIVVEAYAVSRYLADDSKLGDASADYLKAHEAMVWDEWYTIKELNVAATKFGLRASVLLVNLGDCDESWTALNYVNESD